MSARVTCLHLSRRTGVFANFACGQMHGCVQKELAELRKSLQDTLQDFERLNVSTETRLGVQQAEIASLETQIAQSRVQLVKKG